MPGPASACRRERSHFSLVPTSAGKQRITGAVSLHNILFARPSSRYAISYAVSGSGCRSRYTDGGARASSVRAVHVRDTPYRQTGFVITSRSAIANIRVLALRLADFMLLRSVLNE